MIPAPKCFVLGADDARSFTLLYAGDDVQKGLDCFEKHPKDTHQIWLFRNGTLLRTKATPTAVVIRRAQEEEALKHSQEAYEKAVAAAKKKKDDELAAKKAAGEAIVKKMATENAARNKARATRDAELLQRAADRKRAQSAPVSDKTDKTEKAATK